MMMEMLFLIMYLIGGLSFLLVRKHFFLLLLSLEFLMLSLFLMLMLMFLSFNNEYYFLMIFMIFMVCEGVLGLSVMVSMLRIYGNDYFHSFNILGC